MKSVEESFALHEQYLTKLSSIAKDVSDYGSKLDDRLKQNVRGETRGREREREGQWNRKMLIICYCLEFHLKSACPSVKPLLSMVHFFRISCSC